VPSPERLSDTQSLDARFRRPLLRYFVRRTGEYAEAEDLTQEVFLRLHRADLAQGAATKDSLVFTIAANLMRDRFRSLHRRSAAKHVDLAEIDCSHEGLVEYLHPERVVLGRDTIQALIAALNQLPQRTREIFMTFRFEAVSQATIAASYGISVSAVEKHIARALVHLNEVLARQ
jgi:RNA polymerase sigma-70 factor (ECF subfamily)